MIKKILTYFKQIFINLSIVFLFIIAIWYPIPVISPLVKQVDYIFYDHVIKQFWHVQPPQVKVAIIDIDAKSLNEQGKWPWPRDKIAQLITALKKEGVVVSVLDIVMTRKGRNPATELKEKISLLRTNHKLERLKKTLTSLETEVDNDKLLAKVMAGQDIVLGILFHQEKNATEGALPKPLSLGSEAKNVNFHHFSGYSGSLPMFMQAAKNGGVVSDVPDFDGLIRTGIMIDEYNGKLYPNLALQTAMVYLLSDSLNLKFNNGKLVGITLDHIFIPTTSRGEILIPFYGEPGSLSYYSATDVMNHKIPKSALTGSIAIVGSSMILLSDLHNTPVATLFPGAELIGNMITGIISNQIITPYSNNRLTATLLVLVIGSIYAITLPMVSLGIMLLLLVLALVVIVTGFIISLVYFQAYIPIAVIVLIVFTQAIINSVYAYFTEIRQKKKISRLFGQYVPESYVEALIDSDETITMEGEMRDMTVLFSDIRSFTSISQSLPPSEVKRTLNTFFTPITKIIFDNKGTIDKYVGDLVMAFWGAPIKDSLHPNHAMSAALTMIEQLPTINQTMEDNDLPSIQIGIGLASGEMNIGDMGSEFRRAYTVLGDTVNLASRLESLTKFYQVDILVNETLVEQVDEIVWLPIDKVTVKGRNIAETIYQPLGWATQVDNRTMEARKRYIEALSYYYDQNWDKSKSLFEQLATEMPDRYLFQLYLQRINIFIKKPPPKDWEGVFIHAKK